MDALLAEPLPQSPMEREVRRVRFSALIERRNAAAQAFLETARRAVSFQSAPSVAPDQHPTREVQQHSAVVEATLAPRDENVLRPGFETPG
jgi:hypothetical protein